MEVDISGVSVAIGMPTYRSFPRQTVMSLCGTVNQLARAGIPFDVIMDTDTIVQWSRDAVLHKFLQTDLQKLFWIDSDMAWEADSFLRLLALSTKYDVIGASYPLKLDKATYAVQLDPRPQISAHGLLSVHGLGLGFCCIDRKVLEKLSAKAPMGHFGLSGNAYPTVFRTDVVAGERVGEDMAFFEDIRGLGYNIWVDPTIELGHVGEKEWRGKLSDTFKPVNVTIQKEQVSGRDSAERAEAGAGSAEEDQHDAGSGVAGGAASAAA